MWNKIKDFCTIFQRYQLLLIELEASVVAASAIAHAVAETTIKMQQEIDALSNKLKHDKDTIISLRELAGKNEIEVENWKMRADFRTEQYQYWMHLANQQHKLTVEEAFTYAKTLDNARKNANR